MPRRGMTSIRFHRSHHSREGIFTCFEHPMQYNVQLDYMYTNGPRDTSHVCVPISSHDLQ